MSYRREGVSVGRPIGAAECWVVAALLAASAGCQTPPRTEAERIARMPVERNIIGVVPIFLSSDPFGRVGGESKIGAFRFSALYLMAPDGKGSTTGVFGDGIIHVYMYRLDPPAEGSTEKTRTLAHEWVFDVEQAKPFRSIRPSAAGYGYGLICAWGDADVLGKEVEIEVHFERKDGRIIASNPRRFTVPRQ